MLHSVRRAVALVAAPALATFALVAAPTAASAATVDPAPATAAANWLAAQAPDYGPFGTGNTIDQALALDAVGGHDSTVQAIGAGVADHLTAYTDYAYCDSSYGTPPCPAGEHAIAGISAGAVAKALAGLQAAGIDATDVDGVNLVTKLESLLPNSGALTGRAVSQQTSDGSPTVSGYTNVIGQGFAVRGLEAASSGEAPAATAYLVGLQCANGAFKEDLPAEGVAQSCAATTSSTSVDTTALAVLALQTVDSPAADAAVAKASTWLRSVQQISGGFASDGSAAGPNANSTGVATQALRLTGSAQAAAKGATWVRAHQLQSQGVCRAVAAAHRGALAYDDASLAAGITVASYGTWLRATVQALPALLSAPAGTGARVRATTGYVRAGTKQRVSVTGAAPGEALCTTAGSQRLAAHASSTGTAQFTIALPARTATTVVTVSKSASVAGRATIKALGAKRLPVALRAAKMRKGRLQVVRVSGLAAGEAATVRVLGKIKRGHATTRGIFRTTVRVTGKPRRVKVVVLGQFGNRTNTKSFRVVR